MDAETSARSSAGPTPDGAATEVGDGATGETDDGDDRADDATAVEPSDAFGALGNEGRLEILRALADAREDDARPSFSELFEANSTETTAGFAYHLRQLVGHFVRGTGAGYALAPAGLAAVRSLRSGEQTELVGFGPVAVGDPCPFCGDELVAVGADNAVTVACEGCGRSVLRLPFPPGGHRDRDPGELLAAFDRHHRARLSAMTDGVCPECAATVESGVARPPGRAVEILPGAADDAGRAHLRLDCRECGARLHGPVTLAVLDHPAVVAFYREHDRDLREQPIWNLGDEWRETVVSEDPWCVAVSTRLDDEELVLYVDGDGAVRATRRHEC